MRNQFAYEKIGMARREIGVAAAEWRHQLGDGQFAQQHKASSNGLPSGNTLVIGSAII